MNHSEIEQPVWTTFSPKCAYIRYGWYLRVTSASKENSRFGDSWIRELRDWGSKDSNSVDIELGAVASSNGWKKEKCTL